MAEIVDFYAKRNKAHPEETMMELPVEEEKFVAPKLTEAQYNRADRMLKLNPNLRKAYNKFMAEVFPEVELN